MTFVVKEVSNKSEWEEFVLGLSPNTFLHSWSWGEMQKILGEKIIRFGVYDGEKLCGVALGITVSARRGHFLFCPHGPLAENGKHELVISLLGALKEHAAKNNLLFLRVSPLEITNEENDSFYKKFGMRPAPMHVHAETMWILDIKLTEEELLKGMRKTTRNLVKRAERDGVKIRISREKKDLETFEKLYTETADRENFVGFSRNFLDTEFEAFIVDNNVFFAFAEYQGDVISGALITAYGNTGFYHQGASTRKWPKIPGAYLLQWEIIRELKRLGKERYNFWGIAPAEDKNHPWAGLSLFKQGFGGYCENYVHAQDLPLRPAYWLTWLIEEIRRRKRKY
jgi:lipid II:glycine glycyltransferase (peptidoglycan interpeptide bridge formation enzyme)